MNIDLISPGKDMPNDINVVIEISANSAPIKYEFDKETGALCVDRFMGRVSSVSSTSRPGKRPRASTKPVATPDSAASTVARPATFSDSASATQTASMPAITQGF